MLYDPKRKVLEKSVESPSRGNSFLNLSRL